MLHFFGMRNQQLDAEMNTSTFGMVNSETLNGEILHIKKGMYLNNYLHAYVGMFGLGSN
jgi:hypothetical protein